MWAKQSPYNCAKALWGRSAGRGASYAIIRLFGVFFRLVRGSAKSETLGAEHHLSRW